MKKFIPIIVLLILTAAAFTFSARTNAEAIDPALQQMIQQDHIMVGLLVNYIGEMQQRGILPKQEEQK